MMTKVCLQAPAKINLYLQVLGRRDDGYHLLATLMQKLHLFDLVEIEINAGGVTLDCPDSDLPRNKENIALRAAHLFLRTYASRLPRDFGVHITLRKHIPIAAGLGGGSSDAAAVLVGLDGIFQTNIAQDELAAIGVKLGADVPFFIYDWPVAWATGIGDRLSEAVGLKNVLVLLVNPGFSVSTKLIYEKLALTLNEKKINLKNSQFRDVWNVDNPFAGRLFTPDDLRNDLEQVTSSLFKEIVDIKEQLLAAGASCALMSGSGATVFALFDKGAHEQAMICYKQLAEVYEYVFLTQPLSNELDRFSAPEKIE